MKYKFCSIERHIDCVTDLVLDPITGYLYSISKDKSLIKTDVVNTNE